VHLLDRACVSTLLELLLYQVPSFIVFIVTITCFSSYIHLDLKLVFPRGGFSRVMLTKNTVYKCILLVLRSVHYQQLNDVLGVLYLFELHVLISYGKNDMLEHPNRKYNHNNQLESS
jgi:hypothetical protein